MTYTQAPALESPMGAIKGRISDRSLALLVGQAGLVLVVVLAFATSQSARHWVTLALWLFGAVTLREALLFPRLGYTDPRVLVGLIAFLSGYLSPMVEVYLGQHDPDFSYSGDWRTWFGLLALLNLAGFLVYLGIQRLLYSKTGSVRKLWTANIRTSPVWWVGIGLSFLSIPAYYGLLLTDPTRLASEGIEAARGTGWLLVLTDTFVLLIFIRYLSKYRDGEVSRLSVPWRLLVLLAVFVAQFLIVGLRGSRSSVVWVVVACLAIYELRGRKLKPHLVGPMLAAVLAFAFVYSIYKEDRMGTFHAVTGRLDLRYVMQHSDRLSSTHFLVGDLSRNDPQAFLLYRTTMDRPFVDLAYGRTYLSGLAIGIPKNVWPDRPNWRREYATNLIYGPGTYDEDDFSTSRIFGLTGEALLNWGPHGVLPTFGIFGALIGYVRKKRDTLQPNDVRKYWFAVFSVLAVLMYWSDMDNIVFAFIRNLLLLSVLILIGHRSHPIEPTPAFEERKRR